MVGRFATLAIGLVVAIASVAQAEVTEVRLSKHVGVGGLASRPKLVAEFVKLGARYVSTGTDLGFLLAEATSRAKQVRDIAL
jgi:2-keto-3-deoxy-L-rhamnonate aldolase RhmA